MWADAQHGPAKLGLLLSLVVACGSPEHRTPARSPSHAQHSDPVPLGSGQSWLANQQLEQLAKEMGRVSLRIEREGTLDQRERWAQRVSDIEHDRQLLHERLQYHQQMPEAKGAETREAVTAMIEVLFVIGTKTAIEIDRALDRDWSARIAPASGSR